MAHNVSFDLQSHVDYLTDAREARLAFNATSIAEFREWQRVLREKLLKLLGLDGRVRPDPVTGRRITVVQRNGYTEEKVALDVGEGVQAPIYILVPEDEPPFKAIMVFHGHNPSVQYVLGNYPSEEIAQEMRAVDNNYAQALAQAGYLVCAVEQRGFGERQSTQFPDHEHSCRHLAFNYALAGRTLLGERIWDGLCAIDFLLQRADIVQKTLGCTGNSGGGTTTLWLSALDERVTVVVPSCYFCSFSASIGAILHCECNYVPGILQWAEMGDLAALIAPRPMRFINGLLDDIFPIQGTCEQYQRVKRAYELLGAGEKCSLAVHPDAHRYDHALSHEWFTKWL
jgi:dienelactone hydrolase